MHTVPFERDAPAPKPAKLEPVPVIVPKAPTLGDIGNPIGRVIAGKYVVDASLGEGACGKVYRARQITLDKEVAIKVLHRTLSRQPALIERFHREARAASKLDHPNSVRVLDFGQEPDGLLYLVMDYVAGFDLEVRLRESSFGTRRIAIVLTQALAALAVAHDHGIIHRDLKPENILLVPGVTDDGEDIDVVKVCDFGLATLATVDREAASGRRQRCAQLTEHGLVVGTPEYMSPEQARGDELDPRSDVYAIGAILYQMLTGRPPFVSANPIEVAIMHLTDRVIPPSQVADGVDPELERICLRALQKDRKARYDDARQMRADLRAVMTARGSQLPPLPSARPIAPDGPSPDAPVREETEQTPFVLARAPLRPSTAAIGATAMFAAMVWVPVLGPRAASAFLQRDPFVVTAAAARIESEHMSRRWIAPR